MKKILLSAMALLPLAVLAQKPFSINANIKGLKAGDKVYLAYKGDGGNVTDSTVVANGAFTFKGTLSSATRANLFLNKNLMVSRPAPGEKVDMLALYIEPATIKLAAADSLKNAVITGSTANDDDKKLKALTKSLSDQ